MSTQPESFKDALDEIQRLHNVNVALMEALQLLLEQYNPLFDNSNNEHVEAYYTARSTLEKAKQNETI